MGLFGRALAPPKIAPALAFLVERLLYQSRFEKTFGKTASTIDVYSRSRLEPRFVAPPLQWKLEEAPGAAPCLELLQNELFGRAPAKANFGVLSNRPYIFVFTEEHNPSSNWTVRVWAFLRRNIN